MKIQTMPHVNTIQSAHSCVLGAMSAECELDLELARTAIGRIADVATRRNAQKILVSLPSNSGQIATIAGAEGGVMIPRTCLIGRRITGRKRLLGGFVDGCALSPQYLGLGTQPVVEVGPLADYLAPR